MGAAEVGGKQQSGAQIVQAVRRSVHWQ